MHIAIPLSLQLRVQRSPLVLSMAALLVALLAALPLGYMLLRTWHATPGVWGRLWHGQIPGLLENTIWLVITTIGFTLIIGVAAAWLVERTDLPGRSIWRWLLALPLAIPAYVAAICWIILLRRGGLVEAAAINMFDLPRGQLPLPRIYNLTGATLVIGLSVFPYVYLPVAASLRSLDRTLEEAARISGHGPWQTFRCITLPLIAPAAAAGALLVSLYVLSDFGTVAMLRYRTFTVAIFQQFTGQIDRSGASILSFVLIGLTLPLLMGEAWASQRMRRTTRAAAWRPVQIVHLGRGRWLACAAVAILVLLSSGIPLLVLGGLSVQGIFFPTRVDQIWGINSQGLWQTGLGSLIVAAAAATLATLLSFAPALLATRYPGRFSGMLLAASKSAFALPGIIAGLALVLLFNRWVPFIYGTIMMMIIGFALRLLPQAVATNEAALRRVGPSLEQAARVMGCRPVAVFHRVTLPIAAPGIAASWALIFITSMKELPMAIMLRPPGFDTLPVRIWAAASESVHTQAAPAAFLLIVLTLLTLLLLMGRSRVGLDRVLLEHN